MAAVKRIFLLLFSFGIITYSLVSLLKIVTTFAADFSVYYHAGLHVLHRQSLYTNISFTLFAYPPVSSFFYVLFAWIPYPIAQGTFVITSYLCVFVSVFLTFKLLKQKPAVHIYLTAIALMLLSFPTKFTLGMGQSNLLALAIFLSAIILDRREKKMFAGSMFALAIIFKPIFIFFILYFLFTRSFKTIIFTIVTGIVVVLLQIVLFPAIVANWQEYITRVLPELFTSQGREVYYNQGMLGTLSRIVSNTILRTVINWVGSIMLLATTVWILSKTKYDNNYTLALFLCLLPMLDSLSWQHHFVILLFPMMYAFYNLKNNPILLTVLGAAYALISYNIKVPQHVTQIPYSLVASHVFWGALLLLGILLYHGYSNRLQLSTRKR